MPLLSAPDSLGYVSLYYVFVYHTILVFQNKPKSRQYAHTFERILQMGAGYNTMKTGVESRFLKSL